MIRGMRRTAGRWGRARPDGRARRCPGLHHIWLVL